MALIKPLDVLVFVLGAALLGFWFFLYAKGSNKYESLFEGLDKDEYSFKELYFVGYALQEVLHMDYKTKHDRKMRKQLAVLYGDKYVEYYLRVVYAKQFTLTLMVMEVAAPFYFLSMGDPTMLALVLGMAAFIGYYYGMAVDRQIAKRNEEILMQFPDMVSKLALLINAGMILRESWERVACSKEGVLFREMQASVIEMQNGISELDAIQNFGQRCMIPEMKKIASTLIQGASKGNRELSQVMIRQSEEAWTTKKHEVKRLGEAANGQLLLPICISFMGVLITVIVPIFANLGV